MLSIALNHEGYDVHYAFNGKEGYEKVLSLNPDLIILDLMLPGMNGIEVIRAVKTHKDFRDVPIIVVTAYEDRVSMVESSVKALGAPVFLRKPISMSELVMHVKRELAQVQKKETPPPELRKGAVRADPRFRTVWVEDRLVATLPIRRFQLLKLLMDADGEVSKEALVKQLGGETTVHAVEKAIQRLREDFGSHESKRIQTTEHGYQLIG
jgi:DNA-binding response OmpR family regulator